MEGDTVRRTSGRVCAQIRPGRQGEAVHVDLHEIEVQTAERESRKRKATVSRPTQEDDDDFVNPPQRNNAVERESGKRKATVSPPTQEGIHMSISQKLRGKNTYHLHYVNLKLSIQIDAQDDYGLDLREIEANQEYDHMNK
ncbi:hypothetical protein LXL04_006878 [Taraxacum kok-saghyz]